MYYINAKTISFMEFIMQNNIQSEQMMCHPKPGS